MRTPSECSLSITGEIIANDTAANLKATLAGDRIMITVDGAYARCRIGCRRRSGQRADHLERIARGHDCRTI